MMKVNLILCLLIAVNVRSIRCFPKVEGEIPLFDAKSACDVKTKPHLIGNAFGFITLPNYDRTGLYPYPDGLNCSWTLTAPEGKVIWVKTMDLDLDKDCQGSLALMDVEQDQVFDTFCGRNERNFRSHKNALHLRFIGRPKSSTINQHKGFKLYFEHTLPPITCPEGHKKCRNGKKCFDKDVTCNGQDDCDDGTDEEKCDPQEKATNFPENCGSPAITPDIKPLKTRIVGGSVAIPGSWPWQVSLRVIGREPDGHLCGGIVINREWVLTAAHCFNEYYNERDWTLNFGKHNKLIKDKGEVVRYIEAIEQHDDYNLGDSDNDIALLKLNAKLPANMGTISAVCLPNKSSEELKPGATAVVTGWGDTLGTGYDYVLKQAQVPIISNQQCVEWLPWMSITENMVCAGYEGGGQDSCQGDSGGPMVVDQGGHWTLIGLTAGGSRCCGKCPKQPGVYTRVYKYYHWITKTMDEFDNKLVQ